MSRILTCVIFPPLSSPCLQIWIWRLLYHIILGTALFCLPFWTCGHLRITWFISYLAAFGMQWSFVDLLLFHTERVWFLGTPAFFQIFRSWGISQNKVYGSGMKLFMFILLKCLKHCSAGVKKSTPSLSFSRLRHLVVQGSLLNDWCAQSGCRELHATWHEVGGIASLWHTDVYSCRLRAKSWGKWRAKRQTILPTILSKHSSPGMASRWLHILRSKFFARSTDGCCCLPCR